VPVQNVGQAITQCTNDIFRRLGMAVDIVFGAWGRESFRTLDMARSNVVLPSMRSAWATGTRNVIQSPPPERCADDRSMSWWVSQESTSSSESGWGATRAWTSSVDKCAPYLTPLSTTGTTGRV
jgi:hypothetical protein